MHTRPLYVHIRKILQISGADILKEPRRFYAFLMDLATDHPEDVRCIVQNCDERFLNRFYRMRKSSMSEIRKAVDGASSYLHTERSLPLKDAEKIALAFGMGLASYLHPDEKWPTDAPRQSRARKTSVSSVTVSSAAVSAAAGQANAVPSSMHNPNSVSQGHKAPSKTAGRIQSKAAPLTERQKQREREELRKSMEAEAELARIREQAVLQGRQKTNADRSSTGKSPQKNWESQRWIPIWEQQPIGSSTANRASQAALPVRRKKPEPEEPRQMRKSEAVLSNERDARRKLHEETMRMFRRNRNTEMSSPAPEETSSAPQIPSFKNGQTSTSESTQVFPVRHSTPYDPALSDSALQADLKITTAGGDVLRRVMKGAKLPIQLTIYPRNQRTFSDGICLYEGHRLKYTLTEEAAQNSEGKRLIFTYTADGTIADAVLYGAGSGKTYSVQVQKMSELF
ncbi:MAG: hypothetical protein ACI4ET_05660 [Bilifractor sp.]